MTLHLTWNQSRYWWIRERIWRKVNQPTNQLIWWSDNVFIKSDFNYLFKVSHVLIILIPGWIKYFAIFLVGILWYFIKYCMLFNDNSGCSHTHTHTHTHTHIYIYIYVHSSMGFELSGEGIYGYRSHNEKLFKWIEHSGIR